MRIWGYVFIVLNIGAAGAFTFLATSVWKARTEWQYALMKQELVNRGLPVDGPEHPEQDLDKGVVPFGFTYQVGAGERTVENISKSQLTKLVPPGAGILAFKGGDVVANQTDEVKRVEKIIFDDLEKAATPAEKRVRLLLVLINLSKGMGREGTFALLYDYPRFVAALKELDDVEMTKKQFEWQERRVIKERQMARARAELAFLGKSGQQVSALLALNAVEEANLAYAPNVSPDERKRRLKTWRDAIIAWALGQAAYATPDALPPVVPPPPSDEPKEQTLDQKEKERLASALTTVLEPLMSGDVPAPADADLAKQRLMGLLEGDESLQRESAKIMVPFIAEIGTNLLDAEDKIAQVKTKLVELMVLNSTTEAEKKSLTAVADLIVPPKAEADTNEIQRVDAAIAVAATEQLRAYFEQAIAKPSTDLPAESLQARSKLASLKPIRDPGDKRRAIAHLLYHLDAYVGSDDEPRAVWYNLFILNDPKASATPEGFRFQTNDDDLRKSRPLWHQRVAAVVGLESYVGAAEAQATEYAKMVDRIRTRIAQEQGIFETKYQNIVEEAIVGARLLTVREREVKEKTANRDLAMARLTAEDAQLQMQKDLLAAATKTASTALTNLEMKVDELFQITKQLGDAQDTLVNLELNLRNLEIGSPDKKNK